MPDVPAEDPRDALIREQAARIEAQATEIAGQAERVAVLEALIADVREQLAAAARAGSRNSGNSSMPPSSDDLPGRKPPRRERRAAERAGRRKQGKQPGSPGASMTWEVPDRTVDHYPGGACSCGRDLAGAADLGVSRSYQQEEIPAAAAERVQARPAPREVRLRQCACRAAPGGRAGLRAVHRPRLRALAV